MRYRSTGADGPSVDLGTALLEGLAPDGGLYMPETIPRLDAGAFAGLLGRDLVDIGCALGAPFLEELAAEELRELVAGALDFPIPLRQLGERLYSLELFHGPTLAFKDVGARFLARLLPRVAGDGGGPVTILVATSGDTGGAVAQAFHGVEGMRVAVLFPRGKVSLTQERQFSTLGGNVRSFAVEGSFDDCQRLAKQALRHAGLRARLRLSSANSINIGRLLPQSFYYVHALAQAGSPEDRPRVLFGVPSGNFGNLTAGLIAQDMGMPCAGFLAATNANDVVPRYLDTGIFEARPTIPTLSSAMDVGDPSNFARILDLHGGDVARLRKRVRGRAFDDDSTRRCIASTARESGVVLDPHTAVGVLAMREELRERADEGLTGIVLATAHPAKFRELLEPLLGRELEPPARLARCLDRPSRAEPLRGRLEALAAALEDWDREA